MSALSCTGKISKVTILSQETNSIKQKECTFLERGGQLDGRKKNLERKERAWVKKSREEINNKVRGGNGWEFSLLGLRRKKCPTASGKRGLEMGRRSLRNCCPASQEGSH